MSRCYETLKTILYLKIVKPYRLCHTFAHSAIDKRKMILKLPEIKPIGLNSCHTFGRAKLTRILYQTQAWNLRIFTFVKLDRQDLYCKNNITLFTLLKVLYFKFSTKQTTFSYHGTSVTCYPRNFGEYGISADFLYYTPIYNIS